MLITGFAPFLNQSINSSAVLARALAQELKVESLILPVVFEKSFIHLKNHIDSKSHFPKKIWLLGQAKGRSHIEIERVALNWHEMSVTDEEGNLLGPGPLDPYSPSAIIQSNWFIDKLQLDPHIFKISHSAGTFVCNDLYYRSLQAWPEKRQDIIFIHLPLLPEQITSKDNENTPTLDFDIQFQTIKKLFTAAENESSAPC